MSNEVMYTTHERFSIEVPETALELLVTIVYFDQPSCAMAEHWECTPTHQSGETIRYVDNNETLYYIPKFCSLAELTELYTKQGRASPSKEAYATLKRTLAYDITASCYGYKFTAKIQGREVIKDELFAYGFEWSPEDKMSLLEYGKKHFMDECQAECVSLVRQKVWDLLESVDAMHTLVAGYYG